MAVICTVTALKHWQPCSTWPYCTRGRVFVFCWWRRHVNPDTRRSLGSEEGTVLFVFFPWRNDGSYRVCPNRRNASSWAEPSDGGGASVCHPWRFHRPQNGSWEHGEQHPGLRQGTGRVFRSWNPSPMLIFLLEINSNSHLKWQFTRLSTLRQVLQKHSKCMAIFSICVSPAAVIRCTQHKAGLFFLIVHLCRRTEVRMTVFF